MQDEPTDFYNEFLRHSALLPDLSLSLIELTGEDRLDWLQGQATNDLRGIEPSSASISFCLCSATGQLEAVCDVWTMDARLLVVTDKLGSDALLDRAEKMVVLEDVQARNLTSDFRLRSLQGPNSGGFGSFKVNEYYELNEWQNFRSREETEKGILVFRSHRLGGEGWDFWIGTGVWDSFGPTPLEHGGDGIKGSEEVMPDEIYEVLRLEAGVPLRGADYNAKTLPPELGPAFERTHISYNKGCYTGQEVLMRIHSRGHTNKTWVGLLLDAPVEVGAKVSSVGDGDVGVVTSAAVSPRLGPIAAAMLRNEASQDGTEVVVGDVRGRVKNFPLI